MIAREIRTFLPFASSCVPSFSLVDGFPAPRMVELKRRIGNDCPVMHSSSHGDTLEVRGEKSSGRVVYFFFRKYK